MPGNEVTTQETLPAEVDVAAADASKAASGVGLKDVLSKELGKTFPTDEAALKAVKDTFSYVGRQDSLRETLKAVKTRFNTDEAGVLKLMEDLQNKTEAPAARPELESQVKELRERLDEATFYNEHGDLKPYRALLSELRGSSDKPLQEIANSEAFKAVVEKAKAHDELESKKSVLQSNPRLGQAKSKMDSAQELLKAGDRSGARATAVGAVIEAFGIKG